MITFLQIGTISVSLDTFFAQKLTKRALKDESGSSLYGDFNTEVHSDSSSLGDRYIDSDFREVEKIVRRRAKIDVDVFSTGSS